MENYTLHIALANVPIKDELEFVKKIEQYYTEYSTNVSTNSNNSKHQEDNLFLGYKYYVMGNYDIAIVSKINSYDFAQRLFIPLGKNKGANTESPTYTYQIVTGILKEKPNVKIDDNLYKKYKFLGICNFKLNNGFVVGNGTIFTDAVAEIFKLKLKEILNDKGDFIIMNSFSWFEFSILCYVNEPNLISTIISILRGLQIHELKKNKAYKSILQNSAKEILNKNKETLGTKNIVSDTHSYFCINYDFMNDPESKKTEIELTTEIEWQIKPGHTSEFKRNLIDKLGTIFKPDSDYLITGKTDLVVEENESKKLSNNIEIQQVFNKEMSEKEDGGKLINQISNIKTKVYLHYRPTGNKNSDSNSCSFRKLLVNNIDLGEINSDLKSLKISKQCRANVLKMFYHYKNGINDPILSLYFFDFYYFIKNVLRNIEVYVKFLDNPYDNKIIHNVDDYENFNSVEEFEYKLSESFLVFERAFNVRMLNSYRYEDISDINLDFNSSIQQLLSMYNTLAFSVGEIFKTDRNNKIISVNYKSTVANVTSINYNVYDLLTPEFIFYSLPKEILNYHSAQSKDTNYSQILNELESEFEFLISDFNQTSYSEYLHGFLEAEILDFKYLYIEAIRFFFSFNCNKDCFVYWTWAYAFKTSSAYNITGSFRQRCFEIELIRIVFTLKLYEQGTSDLKCPLPQLETYWNKLYKRVEEEISTFFLGHSQFVNKMKSEIDNRLETFLIEKEIAKNTTIISLEEKLKEDQKSINNFKIDNCVINADNLRLIMMQYLHFIYDNNKNNQNDYIHFLYRDWDTGEVINNYNDIDKKGTKTEIDYYYRIDQTGGVFFPCSEKMKEYFLIRNKMLMSLWDFAMRETRSNVEKIYKINNAN